MFTTHQSHYPWRYREADEIERAAVFMQASSPLCEGTSRMVLHASPNAGFNTPKKRSFDVMETTPSGCKPSIIKIGGHLQYKRQNINITLLPCDENEDPKRYHALLFTPTKPKSSPPSPEQVNIDTHIKHTTNQISLENLEQRQGAKRSPSQQQVMKQSARNAVLQLFDSSSTALQNLLKVDAHTLMQIKMEWCHSHAFSLDGDQSVENLNAGSAHFNTDMMAFEYLVRLIIYTNHTVHGFDKSDASVELKTISTVYAQTNVLKEFTYTFTDLHQVTCNNKKYKTQFSITWPDPLNMSEKPSIGGFNACAELLQGIQEIILGRTANGVLESEQAMIEPDITPNKPGMRTY